ncbi:MAG: hypothetical protein KAY24_12575 [Candidatus Eisenbacteria sp.]|nr:hypothetical protein [Candidatus Eisenbacteria bacterium]
MPSSTPTARGLYAHGAVHADMQSNSATITAEAPQPILIDGKWEVHEIQSGRPLYRSPLENAPGYRPPDDPELDAVVSGRRQVEQIDIRFTGGADSAEGLARQIIRHLNRNDPGALHGLRVTYAEFTEILWPEFPQSRPATNIQSTDAWFFLTRTCASGVNGALDEWGGGDLHFNGFSFDDGLIRYTNFDAISGVHIHACKPSGIEMELTFAHTFVKRDRIWKVYIYKD